MSEATAAPEGCDQYHFRAAGKEFPWCAFTAGHTRCINGDACLNPRHGGKVPPPEPKPEIPLTPPRQGRILGL